MDILKNIVAGIIAFFTSIFGSRGTGPITAPTEKPLTYTPASPIDYPTKTYQNAMANYQFTYPAAANVSEAEDKSVIVDAQSLHVASLYNPSLSLESLLTSSLFCPSNNNQSSVTCKTTAVRPLTNPVGTTGYLVRRTKIIDGVSTEDTAYVFENTHEPGEGVVLGVESPTNENLRVLDDVAASFSFSK